MNRQVQDYENQITTDLQSLSGSLDNLPPLGEAVIERVKAAVRHEINEQWLAEQAPVLPSGKTLERIRASVRDELNRLPAIPASGSPGPNTSIWVRRQQLFAGLAAAASIAICVGLIQHVGTWTATQLDPIAVAYADQQPIDLFVEAAEVALSADETTTAVSRSDSRTGGSIDSVLEDLSDAVLEILSSPQMQDNTMIRPTSGQGAFV